MVARDVHRRRGLVAMTARLAAEIGIVLVIAAGRVVRIMLRGRARREMRIVNELIRKNAPKGQRFEGFDPDLRDRALRRREHAATVQRRADSINSGGRSRDQFRQVG